MKKKDIKSESRGEKIKGKRKWGKTEIIKKYSVFTGLIRFW